VFVSGLDQTVVVTVLPQVITDLNVPITRLDDAAWTVTAYLVGYTAAMPLIGRAADVYGYGRLLAVSAALFAAGSLWAALAGGLWSLVAARSLQALGGGGLVPVALAACAALYPGRSRSLALGLVAGAAEAGAVLGPLYGAGILELLDWRWVFWLNLPLAGIVVLLAREVGGRRGGAEAHRVDWGGGVLAGAALVALTLGLAGDHLADRPLLLAVGVVAAAAFVVWQRRAREPLLPLGLFRRPAFSSANTVNLLIGGALIVALVEIPLYAVVVLDRSPVGAAFGLLRFTALIPVGALLGGWLAGRLSPALVTGAGLTASAAGFLLLSRLGQQVAEPAFTLELSLAGVGFGIVLAPLTAVALATSGRGREAVGAAFLTISRVTGMTLGLAALTTWGLDQFGRRTAELPVPLKQPGQSDADYQAELDRYQVAVRGAAAWVFDRIFLVAAGLCVLAALASALLRRDGR
jgi:MFS family permease